MNILALTKYGLTLSIILIKNKDIYTGIHLIICYNAILLYDSIIVYKKRSTLGSFYSFFNHNLPPYLELHRNSQIISA